MAYIQRYWYQSSGLKGKANQRHVSLTQRTISAEGEREECEWVYGAKQHFLGHENGILTEAGKQQEKGG